MNKRLRDVIILLVTVVWALNFTAPLVIHDYQPPGELNVAFMAILGYLTQVKTKDGGPSDGSSDESSTHGSGEA